MENQLNELKSFLWEYNISIEEQQIDERRNKCEVTFYIQNLESYFVNNQNPSEIVFGKGVKIKMIFSLYPSMLTTRLLIIGENQPFHPHFSTNENIIDKISKKLFHNQIISDGGEWIDYKSHQSIENIVSFLKRVVLSLQFHKDCIDVDSPAIANSKANDWYLKRHQKDSSMFPTGNLFRKKFITKEVNQNIPSGENPDSQNQNSGSDFRFERKSKKKFEVNQEANKEFGSKKFEVKSTFKKKKFTITDETPGYIPSEKAFKIPLTNESLNSTISEETNSRVKILINEDAQKQIWNHIGWGEKTKSNVVEQGGILLGHVYKDLDLGIQFAVVEKAIAGKSAKGSSAYLEMGHEVWKEMIEMVDNYLDANPEYNIQIIGWYHTHPNSLDVFMSGTDRNTQSLHFSKDWHYAIVLNPHRQFWKAFYGKDAIECEGVFLKNLNKTPPPTENEKGSEKPVKEPSKKDEEPPSPLPLPEGKNEPPKKRGNFRNLSMILIIAILSIAAAILYNNKDVSTVEESSIAVIDSSELTYIADTLNTLKNEVIEEIESVKIKPGDTVMVQKGLNIFSKTSKIPIASFQNDFEVIVTYIDNDFLGFEKDLFVGNYHCNKDSSVISLKDSALLKTEKIPRDTEGEKEIIFAISENDSCIYSIINEEQNGWFQVKYTGSIKMTDMQIK